MSTLTAPRGTRDIFSPEILRWQEMEDTARRVLSQACFEEIRTPVFERTELFERGVGEATDIVSKEMYTFESRSGDRLTLRPESTAGVVRAFLEHGMRAQRSMPLKVFYIGPMFRYERPQKGRQRQFHQLGIEILDSAHPRADVEAILAACEYLRALGLEGLVVDLNSLGDAPDRARYREALVNYLESVRDRLDEDSRDRIQRNPLRVLDSKVPATIAALESAPSILDFLGAEARAHFEEVQAGLASLEITTRINSRLVRGLDYYSRTTFEIQSEKLGAQSTVCGGGRYDGLVEELGGPAVPAVGWALGLERLAIILEDLRGASEEAAPVAFVVAAGPAGESAVLRIARDLRRAGVRCDVSFMSAGLGKQLKAADRRGARFAVVLGESELARNAAAVKDLGQGDQFEVSLPDLARAILEKSER
ncbi:MAG TPA: histidine--tRNA ligase [bacterium]|nr:histidine--tRNA ligase [bacterium]